MEFEELTYESENIPGIYMIQSWATDRVYVGATLYLRRRRMNHLSALKRGIHRNIKLQRIWDKYGEDDLTFYILDICHPDFLKDVEQHWIDTLSPDLNCQPYVTLSPEDIGRFNRGKKHSEETKERMRQSALGKVISQAQREKISLSWTEERKEKQRQRNRFQASLNLPRPKLKPITEETREKMRQSALRRLSTEEGKATLAKTHAVLASRPISDETRAKMSESAKRHLALHPRKKKSAALRPIAEEASE